MFLHLLTSSFLQISWRVLSPQHCVTICHYFQTKSISFEPSREVSRLSDSGFLWSVLQCQKDLLDQVGWREQQRGGKDLTWEPRICYCKTCNYPSMAGRMMLGEHEQWDCNRKKSPWILLMIQKFRPICVFSEMGFCVMIEIYFLLPFTSFFRPVKFLHYV